MPTFRARCDKDGFTKILQTHNKPYTPTRNAINLGSITQRLGCKAQAAAENDQACADGSDEKLFIKQGVAVCKGDFKGAVDSDAAHSICSAQNDWTVCTGNDMVQSGLTYSQGRSFPGCYVYNAANDCGGCFATCKGTKSVNGKKGCADRLGGHDIAGLGAHCSIGGRSQACVKGGRINGNQHG